VISHYSQIMNNDIQACLLFLKEVEHKILLAHNARLSGEQRYHYTQLLHRKHNSQIKLKLPSVANPS
ncbi:hypothetical protein, partial [Vibrio diazotrophicus]|uniref:hypothetical protein n=1 Tax=Vibrio diazotrophicus TaxID=685 RepID=UPI000C9DFBE2